MSIDPRASLNQTEIIDLAINPNPLIVESSTLVLEAIALMGMLFKTYSIQENYYSLKTRTIYIFVVEKKRLVGIFTERDAVSLIASTNKLEKITISSVMNREPIFLERSQCKNIFTLLNIFSQKRIQQLPIVDSKQMLLGVVSQESLYQSLHPIDLLKARSISEIVNRNVTCARLDTSLSSLAKIMTSLRVSYVVIQSAAVPLGIITECSIVQLKSMGLDLDILNASMVITTPLITLKPEQSFWDARQVMLKHNLQYVVVTDHFDTLVGIIDKNSLLDSLDPNVVYSYLEFLQSQTERVETDEIPQSALKKNHLQEHQKTHQAIVDVSANQKREDFIAKVSLCIRDGFELRNLLSVVVDGLRTLLNCDRVVAYQLKSSQYGKIVAESVGNNFMTIMNQQIVNTCLQDDDVEQYLLGKIRMIDDIHSVEQPNCHVKLPEKYGVKSSLVVPIAIRGNEEDVASFFEGTVSHKNISKKSLWGFLIAHQCSEPRQWQSEDLKTLDLLSVTVELSLQQMLAKFRTQAKSIEMKHIYSKYRESEERFQHFANNIRQVICIFEIYKSRYETLYVSPSYENVWGRSCESLYNDSYSFIESIHPEDLGIIVDTYRQLRLGNQTSNEYRIVRPDGEIRWIYDRAFPIKNHIGIVDRVSRIAEDISDLKRTKIELLRVKEQLALVLKIPKE